MTSIGHHIGLGPDHLEGNGGLGRYVFLPGDPSRAEKIASHFVDVERVTTPRRFDALLGRLENDGDEPIDVVALPSGIGAPSVEVVLHELMACGARRIVRVGSCGSMSPRILPGQVVIASGAVRDESAGDDYAPREYPAFAHRLALEAMVQGAERASLAGDTFCGIVHSKSTLYAREFGRGPAGERNLDYHDWLKRAGVVASEMEASMLYVMAATRTDPVPILEERGGESVQAVAVLAVFGTDESHMDFDEAAKSKAEQRAIRVAVEGVRAWAAEAL
jgi:uridine phosphorylase